MGSGVSCCGGKATEIVAHQDPPNEPHDKCLVSVETQHGPVQDRYSVCTDAETNTGAWTTGSDDSTDSGVVLGQHPPAKNKDDLPTKLGFVLKFSTPLF